MLKRAIGGGRPFALIKVWEHRRRLGNLWGKKCPTKKAGATGYFSGIIQDMQPGEICFKEFFLALLSPGFCQSCLELCLQMSCLVWNILYLTLTGSGCLADCS